MTTKATTVIREIDLPLDRIHDVVASEEFLLTVDDDGSSALLLSDGVRTVQPDGSVTAAITATVGEGEDALVMVQHTEVSVPAEDGSFTVFTSVPLSNGIGTMATNQVYRPDGAVTRLESTVAVEVNIALMGGKIAAHVLAGAESSTDRGVERIRKLAR